MPFIYNIYRIHVFTLHRQAFGELNQANAILYSTPPKF